MTKEELKHYRDRILELAKQYHAPNVRVFGSTVFQFTPDVILVILVKQYGFVRNRFMESESIAVRLNKELHQPLVDLAAKTGRSKSFYVKRAIAQYLEDMEDTYLAIDRIENSEGRVSMEEAKRILDVDS